MTASVPTLAAERYVLLTTFKRDGTGVATPVWIAQDGDELVFCTASSTWKVRRLRRDPRVTLQACDMRGRPHAEAPVVAGSGRIVQGADFVPVRRAVVRKYGIQMRLIETAERIASLVSKRAPNDTGVRIALD